MRQKTLFTLSILAATAMFFASCDTEEGYDNRQENRNIKRNYLMTDGKSATIISKYNADYDIIIRFAKVMANNLYSIEKVYLAANSNEQLSTHAGANKQLLCKQTNKDMIGPIMVKRPTSGYSWVGGNHLYLDQQSGVKSAATNSYSIYADGTLIKQGATYADTITIRVENTIYDPDVAPSNGETILSSPLIAENVSYSVSGGEILVSVEHKYLKEVHVGVYYGMQSVFKGGKFITAQGGYNDWENIPATDDFYLKKADAPNFNRFSQKANNNIYCQNSILLPFGLGNHHYVKDDENIFIRSSGKAYHMLMHESKIEKGSLLSWKGIYNWNVPIVDDEYNYIYEYHCCGRIYISVTAKKPYDSVSLPAPKGAENSTFHITGNDENISIDNVIKNDIKLSAKGQGSLCGYFVPLEE